MRHLPAHGRRLTRRSLTLIELIVVLFIIAILATVAITSTTEVVDQTRFTVSDQRVASIRDGILGASVRDPGGRFLPIGFLNDIGRAPEGVEVTANSIRFISPVFELLSRPSAIPNFQFTSPPQDTSVVVGAGWRGPYFSAPFSESALLDGYGNPYLGKGFDGTPFVGKNPDGTLVGDGVAVGEIVALNAGNKEGVAAAQDPFTQDFSVLLKRDGPDPVDRILGSVTVLLEAPEHQPLAPLAENERITAVVYGPVDGVAGQMAATPSAPGEAAAVPAPTFLKVDGISIGRRIVRVYRSNGELRPTGRHLIGNNEDEDDDPENDITWASAPIAIDVIKGGVDITVVVPDP